MTNRGETITMLDEEGAPHDFRLIDVVEVKARRYAVLQPEDREEGAVLFRVEGDRMAPVEDDAEFDEVVDVLRSLEEYDDLIIEDARRERPVDDDDEDDDDDEEDEEGLDEDEGDPVADDEGSIDQDEDDDDDDGDGDDDDEDEEDDDW